MSLALVLEMAVSAGPSRTVVVDDELRVDATELDELTGGGASVIADHHARHVAYVGAGGMMLPMLLFASARAGVPFTPLNYRLSPEGIGELIGRLDMPLVVADARYYDAVAGMGIPVMEAIQFLGAARAAKWINGFVEPDSVAVVLFTSGTTSRPKAVEITHGNLVSYVTGTVEFASAASSDAALVCVPPYHIAGVGAVLSNLYAGRKVVYLKNFDPHDWIRLVRAEGVTTATVVPTMLDRIVRALESEPTELATLRNLAYGGAKVALPLVRKAIGLLPDVGFVNAYGLTETSSTIAVLGPDDHHAAVHATCERVARRLGSVGRVVPGVEVQIRTEAGAIAAPGQRGALLVRGGQVSGRYAEIGSVLDAEGWFDTNDIGWLDDDGYLYIDGRSDDTIIRGGENIAPAEIEDVLVEHPLVREVAVVGDDDPVWGQVIVAVVVTVGDACPDPEDLRVYVRQHLRGSRTPDRVVFRSELPVNAMGKVLRRQIVAELRKAV